MTTYKLTDLKPGTYFSSNLYLDKTFLISTPSTSVSESILKILKDWNFDQVESEGIMGRSPFNAPQPVKVEVKKAEPVKIEIQEAPKGDTEVKNVVAKVREALKTAETEELKLEQIQSVYNVYCRFINKVLTHYATHKEINYQDIAATVNILCAFMRDYKSYMLRITPDMEARTKEFLVNHSIRSTILALAIGIQLKLPATRLIDLGVSCILHEIGMLRLPPQMYMTDKKLTTSEKIQMSAHPIIGFNILKDAQFPVSVQIGVLEHHERETGTGYPRKLSGGEITMDAKIISVACSYEAITAPRHFKEARSTYEAMIEMLRNEKHLYDDSVVKALLLTLSLYPIGEYVYLGNGKIAQVIDVNPSKPKNPIVQLVGVRGPNGQPVNIPTDDDTNRIMRVMTKQEQKDMLSALARQ